MFFTAVRHLARPDHRPLYRRIFTNRRQDILHKSLVRLMVGFLLAGTGFAVTNAAIYYAYVRPIRDEETQVLERQLLEEDTDHL